MSLTVIPKIYDKHCVIILKRMQLKSSINSFKKSIATQHRLKTIEINCFINYF